MMKLDIAPELMEGIRRIVRSQLSLWEWPQLADAAVLGVNELLANVYKHASSNSCTLRVQAVLDGVCFTVSDADRRKPELKDPGWDSEDGHGLHLVAGISHNWGVISTATGKDIWFSLLPGAADGEAS